MLNVVSGRFYFVIKCHSFKDIKANTKTAFHTATLKKNCKLLTIMKHKHVTPPPPPHIPPPPPNDPRFSTSFKGNMLFHLQTKYHNYSMIMHLICSIHMCDFWGDITSAFGFPSHTVLIIRLICHANLPSAKGLLLIATPHPQPQPFLQSITALSQRSGISGHARWGRTAVDAVGIWALVLQGHL